MQDFLIFRLKFKKFLPLFLLVATVFSADSLTAQVVGVSASKLSTIDAVTVHKHYMEVEPSFGYLFSRKAFDDEGKLYSYSPDGDSAIILKDLFFRFTYGAGERLEIGTFITANMSSISFGAKYRFVEHKKFLAAALLGLNFSNNSNFGIRKTGFLGKYIAIATGVALTENFTNRLSLDVETQFQHAFCYDGPLSNSYFLDSDLGYYVFNHTLQLIGGISWQYNHSLTGSPDSYRFSFHPGVTIETGKSFIIVFDTPFDLAGKNAGRFSGFSFAFTLTLR